MSRYTFPKIEKLCNYADIQELFLKGKSVKSSPLKLLYVPIETKCQTPIKVLVSVPKKSLRKAVVRNYIKRIIREAYRLQKHLFVKEQQYAIAFIYLSKQKVNFQTIFDAMTLLAQQWNDALIGNQDDCEQILENKNIN